MNRFATSLACVVGLAGCGSASDLPTDLPSVAAAPSKPRTVQREAPLKPTTARIAVFDESGETLQEPARTSQVLNAKVVYRMPKDDAKPTWVQVVIGRKNRAGQFVIFGTKIGDPVRQENGELLIDVKLKAPTLDGDFVVLGMMNERAIAETTLKVIKAE